MTDATYVYEARGSVRGLLATCPTPELAEAYCDRDRAVCADMPGRNAYSDAMVAERLATPEEYARVEDCPPPEEYVEYGYPGTLGVPGPGHWTTLAIHSWHDDGTHVETWIDSGIDDPCLADAAAEDALWMIGEDPEWTLGEVLSRIPAEAHAEAIRLDAEARERWREARRAREAD